MKRLNLKYVFIFTIILYGMGCKKEGPADNSSSIFSLPIILNNPILANFCVDHSQQYLYLFLRDYTNGATLINQVNISTLKTVRQVRIDHTVPIMAGNVVVTSNNDIITSFYNFSNSSMLLIKFDMALNFLVIDTIAHVPGGNFGRMRIAQGAPGVIIGCQMNAVDTPNYEKWFARWLTMDENLNVITEKIDTGSASFYYGSNVIAGQAMIKTSDGGYITSGYNVDTPYYVSEAYTEKRDAALNLQWRTKLKPPGGADISSLNEYNGRYFVYCQGSDTATNQNKLYVLVYDQNGQLVDNKTISDGASINKKNDPMIMNSKGNFFMLAETTLGASSGNSKGILFTTDGNCNVLNFKTYGGSGNVASSGMIKLNDNKYMLVYLDSSFPLDGNNSRLMVRYINADGNFIE